MLWSVAELIGLNDDIIASIMGQDHASTCGDMFCERQAGRVNNYDTQSCGTYLGTYSGQSCR
jgi:hypothetical protein